MGGARLCAHRHPLTADCLCVFAEYLRQNGYDMSNIGLLDERANDTEAEAGDKKE